MLFVYSVYMTRVFEAQIFINYLLSMLAFCKMLPFLCIKLHAENATR